MAQNVRECQNDPLQTHETPKEKLHRMQEAGDYDYDAIVWKSDSQKPVQSVEKIVGMKGVPDFADAPAHPYIVILGDPGSGKSTLLRSLVVKWAQQQTTEQIPLLIELRRYIQSKKEHECLDFVEFIHKGSNWVNHLDQQQLETWLNQGQVVILLDGLDEVIERQQRSNVLTQIHSFTQRYPQVPVVVTSRVIGYSAETLINAGFHHYMLQDLDEEQIADFIHRWHDQTYSNEVDKQRKRERLKQAIRNSKAIQELAGNPLLLTLMAILNRGEELPRDRVRLYEKASEVLLYQWEVESKLLEDLRLKKYAVEIDFSDKQSMLRQVAYVMQSSEKGLAGNFILREDLQVCLTAYLKDMKEAQSAPSIATIIIDQLRERNFILCSLGGDAYGFVHRTFLEYFCAVEIVNRFEKQRTLTFEQLRDEVFGEHWQDETWWEVLRLICGMIDVKFSDEIIIFLLSKKLDRSDFIEQKRFKRFGEKRLKKEGLAHIFLASTCFREIKKPSQFVAKQLLQRLKIELCDENDILLDLDTAEGICNVIAENFGKDRDTLKWLKQRVDFTNDYAVLAAAILAIEKYFNHQTDTLLWLKHCLLHSNWSVRRAAIWAIQGYYSRDSKSAPDQELCDFLKQLTEKDEDIEVRYSSVRAVAILFKSQQETLCWLQNCAQFSDHEEVRASAIQELLECYEPSPETFDILVKSIESDPAWGVREKAIRLLPRYFTLDDKVVQLLYGTAQSDPFDSSEKSKKWGENPRLIALQILTENNSMSIRLLELLRDRATNDPDEQLQEWAQEQLKTYNMKLEMEVSSNG